MEISRRDRRRADVPMRAVSTVVIGLALTAGLGACQNGSVFSDEGGYPSLSSVPAEARPSASIEERRNIVRTLLEERDQSRRQTAIVRSRSGLSVDPPPASPGENARAEDIVPDTSSSEDDGFRLTPEGGDANAVYRTDSQFDDGGLDDFIRQLKRDTQAPLDVPAATEGPADQDPMSDAADEEDVSALSPEIPAVTARRERLEPPILLAAFAPIIAKPPLAKRDVMIRLAADDDEEPGFFCRRLGWALGWSGACLDEADVEPPENGDDDVAADLEQELRQAPEEEDAGRSTRSGSPSSSEAGRERAERRLSEEDAAEAIEDAGRTALAPVTKSLEKLRDFIRNRPSDDTTSSSPERRPSLRSGRSADPSVEAAAIDRPPTPLSRPERRTSITIEDRGERFDFNRTPRPAFKPTPDAPVILKAKGEHRRLPKTIKPLNPPPEPLLRPSDLLSELKGDGAGAEGQDEAGDSLADQPIALALTTEALDNEEAEAPATSSIDISPDLEMEAPAKVSVATPQISDPPSVSKRAEDAEASISKLLAEPVPVPMIIEFEPGTPGLPGGMGLRLAELLEDAKTRDQKIHIIGEAGTNHLARRRATDVGAALVQLGATVEILEYDHDAIPDVDQVRLVLRAAKPDPLARAAEPTAIEK